MSWSSDSSLRETGGQCRVFPEKHRPVMKTTWIFHIHEFHRIFCEAVGLLSKAMDWGMNLVEESEYWLLENLWKAMRGTSPPVPLVIAEKDYKAHSSGNSVVYGEICWNESENCGVRRWKRRFADHGQWKFQQRVHLIIRKQWQQYHLLILYIDTDTFFWCVMVKCCITFVCLFLWRVTSEPLFFSIKAEGDGKENWFGLSRSIHFKDKSYILCQRPI